MNLSKSIDFLLDQSGPVIRYRLRKEILNDLTSDEEERLLGEIYQTPHFQLIQTYVKPNGYIGSGMHSWSHWRGSVLHQTPLQDGEAATRLLSYYKIPKEHPLVIRFVKAMRNDEVLKKEFSYIPPEIPRYQNRFHGINCGGNSLMVLLYTMQAMLGYGGDFEDIQSFQQICLQGFQRILEISSLQEMTVLNHNTKRKYNYPYITENEFFPNAYPLETLAYTSGWRTKEAVEMLVQAINHINTIMSPDNTLHVYVDGKYMVPLCALIKPFRPFHTDVIDCVMYRRPLTEIAMLGVGERVNVLRESVMNLQEAMGNDGILQMNFRSPHNKQYTPKKIVYPTSYTDVRLEPDYSTRYGLSCDLTFWAVQFLHLCSNAESCKCTNY